jgi:hypothetical protein
MVAATQQQGKLLRLAQSTLAFHQTTSVHLPRAHGLKASEL